ncbi:MULTISPECIES: aminopeptidase [unclassified Sphingobacterium]|uniref:aminopeptidase n=1 Tax=unclassified Sphingobacterium TaxID=2609468 RepID=UPI001AE305ED|nr:MULTISPECIES: aminopeptidase [unclassified Sphingobacterium]MDR6733740.1 bleomycin hydrolase [Sphingobacterium sp. 2149]
MRKKLRKRIVLAIAATILVGIGLFYRFYYLQSSPLLRSEFVFTDLIRLKSTAVKNQGASNTCWSYTGNSFLESEMIRMGKNPVAISPLFTVRMAYLERARNYLRLHGGLKLNEGGQLHDVMDMLRLHGAMPTAAYTGIKAGKSPGDFKRMRAVLNSTLSGMVKTRILKSSWEREIDAVMDDHLGKLPVHFDYQGKEFTARSFADQVIGIDPDQYIHIASVMTAPYYKSFVFLIPDNWSFSQFYNMPMEDLSTVVDGALKKGFTVACTIDISEPGFSWPYGIAYVPQKSVSMMTAEEKRYQFVRPQPERKVDAMIRQRAFDAWETTDDHALHIIGLAKDQHGRAYYVAKNSWGRGNAFRGIVYLTKEYFRYKSTALMVHRDALDASLKSKFYN